MQGSKTRANICVVQKQEEPLIKQAKSYSAKQRKLSRYTVQKVRVPGWPRERGSAK